MPQNRKPMRPALFPGGIAIIGMGRWGTSLNAALSTAGIRPLELVVRNAPKKGSRSRVASPVVSISKAQFDAELLWLCVPDCAISEVAALVAQRVPLEGKVLIHSSGVYASDILKLAKLAGAEFGSVHPLMTFPTLETVDLKGVPFAVEAKGNLLRRLTNLVCALGGVPFAIPAKGKPLYHAAAVMASPLLASLAAGVEATAVLSGLSREQAAALFEPIMLATIHNFFSKGAAKSFSGPLARGDVATVSLHLAALREHPSLQRLYKELAAYALESLPVKNRRSLRARLER